MIGLVPNSLKPQTEIVIPFEESIVSQFSKQFAWDAVLAPRWIPMQDNTLKGKVEINLVQQRCRTDVEPDDLGFYIEMVLALQNYFKQHNDLTTVHVIVSEGAEKYLNMKVETLQLILCELVAEGKVDPLLLHSIQFYTDKPRVAGKGKEEGYEGIYHEALELKKNEKVEAFFRQLAPAQPVEVLYQEFEETRKLANGVSPQILEMSIAPIDGMIEYYTEHPELLPTTRVVDYGSFNIDEGVKRQGADPAATAKKVEQMYRAFASVFDYEAYLATRVPVRTDGTISKDKKGGIQWKDFNRVGGTTHKTLFASLFSPQASMLQKFLLGSFQAWNVPSIRERHDDFCKLGNGEAFLKALDEKINQSPSYSLQEAWALCKEMVPEVTSNKEIETKMERKLKVLHDILVNQKVQGTLSDAALALILRDPEGLIRPECLTKAELSLDFVDGRTNVSFKNNPLGNSFALVSQYDEKEDRPGLDIEKLKEAVRESFERMGNF